MRNTVLASVAVLALSTGGAFAQSSCPFPPDPFGQYDFFNSDPKIFESGITCQQTVDALSANPNGWVAIHSRLFTWQGFDCPAHSAPGQGLPLAYAAVQLFIDGCTQGQMTKIGGNMVTIPY